MVRSGSWEIGAGDKLRAYNIDSRDNAFCRR